nr:insulin-degrading enzyme-like 1, peroxisomal isoform X2 [Tanacetum cinerariifolium]
MPLRCSKQTKLRVHPLTFEGKLYEMPEDEFKSNITALIEMKLEKHMNLREESAYYWREIQYGNLKFDRKEYEGRAIEFIRAVSYRS